MAQMLAKTKDADAPIEAQQYEQASLRLLVKLCRELQRAAGDGPFFLSCRKAGSLLDVPYTTASRWLFLLVTDDVLDVVFKGGPDTNKATRFRYLPPLLPTAQGEGA